MKGEVPVAGAREQIPLSTTPGVSTEHQLPCTLFKEPRREDTELGDEG